MEKHVLSNWFARLDEVWILSGLGRKKPNRNAAGCTVSHTDWTDAAVCFLDTAASTSSCAGCTNGHASNAERAGDFYARIAGADA